MASGYILMICTVCAAGDDSDYLRVWHVVICVCDRWSDYDDLGVLQVTVLIVQYCVKKVLIICV
jgi:hypothetical protein